MRWMIVSVALLLLSLDASATTRSQPSLTGVHSYLECADCHLRSVAETPHPSSASNRASGCTGCHVGYDGIFDQAMTTRTAEKNFVAQTFSSLDTDFFANNCNNCHVSDCLDCHGGNGHGITTSRQEECLVCHKGYYVGSDYLGRAPREDHPRYQRGFEVHGETSLKMRPDLHAEFGLECKDCHSMQSLIDGRKTAKSCVDCHQVGEQVLEHRITAHLKKLECYACHSAWAAQEYGSFFLRIDRDDTETLKFFKATGQMKGDYLRRAYLRRQNEPPLGKNERGLFSPIRPQFISYYSDLRRTGQLENENLLLGAQWKAFFPHTVRAGTVMCDKCHDNPRRYLLENEVDRQYRIDLDGLGLASFWSQEGQQIVNGSFVTPEVFEKVSEKSDSYTRAYVEKWKKLVEHVEASSKD